jgi:hypothetical protein
MTSKDENQKKVDEAQAQFATAQFQLRVAELEVLKAKTLLHAAELRVIYPDRFRG